MACLHIFLLGILIPTLISAKSETPRWCAIKGLEFKKCKLWAQKEGQDKLQCVLGKSSHDCYNLIAKGKADMASFDGGDIYEAGKAFDLKPIMAETTKDSPDELSTYYAVAVVKSGTKWTLDNLMGSSSCHTGVKKTSGWNAPLGYLIQSKRMPLVDCNIFKSAAAFFKSSCAPGANNKRFNPELQGVQQLCDKCIGDGRGHFRCDRSSRELYYGYQGAFKCLQDDAGDVAFIKHSILLQDGVDQSQYKLLCKDNTQKAPSEYRTCNLIKAPAHAVLTSNTKSSKTIKAYQDFLTASSQRFGRSSLGGFKLFGDGKLFSKSTSRLTPLPTHQQTYRAYLDSSYIEMMIGLEGC